MSPLPHGIPTTEPAFIEWQIIIRRYQPPPKILGQKPKATTKVTLSSHQKAQVSCQTEIIDSKIR